MKHKNDILLNPQLSSLWKKRDTEVVVSVVPSQIRGNSYTIRHCDLRTLRPHQWLTGEVCSPNYQNINCENPITFSFAAIAFILNFYVKPETHWYRISDILIELFLVKKCLYFNPKICLDHWKPVSHNCESPESGKQDLHFESLHCGCDSHWRKGSCQETQFIQGKFS